MLKTTLSIDTLDLTDIKKKLCLPFEKGGYAWPSAEADEAVSAYREFLKEVLSKHKSDAATVAAKPSSQIVDIVWHTHILFTEKYHQDCQVIFGHYLHHQPEV